VGPLAALLVFLSYSHTDRPAALDLRTALQAAGCVVMTDRDIRAGEDWTVHVEDAIDRAGTVVVLLGPRRAGLAVRAEYLRALRKGKRVIPVLVVPGADVPLPLEPLHRVSITEAVKAIECK
jgi:hypothetical protein